MDELFSTSLIESLSLNFSEKTQLLGTNFKKDCKIKSLFGLLSTNPENLSKPYLQFQISIHSRFQNLVGITYKNGSVRCDSLRVAQKNDATTSHERSLFEHVQCTQAHYVRMMQLNSLLEPHALSRISQNGYYACFQLDFEI